MSLRRRKNASPVSGHNPTSRDSDTLPKSHPWNATRVLVFAALCVVIVCCGYWVLSGQRGGAGEILVGVSKLDVTPSSSASLWLSGFSSRTRPPSAKEVEESDRLFVRVIAFKPAEGEGKFMFWIGLDLIGISAELSERIFMRLEDELAIDRQHARLCFSHTHSGPVVGKHLFPLYPEAVLSRAEYDAYADMLVDVVLQSVTNASNPMRTVRASVRFGRASCAMAVNRRQVEEQQYTGEVRGDVDDRVPILWFIQRTRTTPVWRFGSESIIGGVFGYAAHASVVTTGYSYSPDYPGYAATALEENARVGGVWVFAAGAGGDVNVYPRGTRAHGVEHGRRLGRSVANYVTSHNSDLSVGGPGISVASSFVDLPFRTQLRARELRRLARGKDEHARRMASHWLNRLSIAESCIRAGFGPQTTGCSQHVASRTPAEYKYPVSVWRIGCVKVVFLGGEPTVEYSGLLERESGADWVVGYTDDVMGYVGSRSVIQGGGREGSDRSAVYYGLPCGWDASVEDALVRAVRTLMESVDGSEKLC